MTSRQLAIFTHLNVYKSITTYRSSNELSPANVPFEILVSLLESKYLKNIYFV